ncbi:MAG: hypothetical protein ACT4P3_19650 [Betaproteobacteria bacterium]
MGPDVYLAYVAACFVIAVIPGPTVTVIAANSLACSTRAGLLNVAGTQLGLALMMATVVVGLSTVIAVMGAFIPQFVDPGGDYVAQIVLLGVTAMAVALVSDGAYAVLTGRAGALLSRRRVRLVSRLGGAFLIGGGVWLALTRR